MIKEVPLNEDETWVIKSAKKPEHIDEVPNDIAKQYLALTMSKYFNRFLKIMYPKEEVYIKYI